MRLRSASNVKIASASQTSAKPIHLLAGIGSCTTNTPQANCRTGAMYCSMPMVLSGTSRAPAPKNSNGMTVTMPVLRISRVCPVPALVNVFAPPRASR